jgi:hypothetical protein
MQEGKEEAQKGRKEGRKEGKGQGTRNMGRTAAGEQKQVNLVELA